MASSQRRQLGDFFLILGLGVVWFARRLAGVQDGAVLVSFVIVPALLYIVLRGDLAELRGPGGWAAMCWNRSLTPAFSSAPG